MAGAPFRSNGRPSGDNGSPSVPDDAQATGDEEGTQRGPNAEAGEGLDNENERLDEDREPPSFTRTVSDRRVFTTHGKNVKIVDQLKTILSSGRFEPVVTLEQQTTARTSTDKVMDEMRSCSAGVVHVGEEQQLIDLEGNEHTTTNRNVLIEIGTAVALCGRNLILLVEKGVSLPSNLQGLYEVRFEGDKLDHDATMKFLAAFNDFSQTLRARSRNLCPVPGNQVRLARQHKSATYMLLVPLGPLELRQSCWGSIASGGIRAFSCLRDE